MTIRPVLAGILLTLITTHTWANDFDDCMKATGETAIAACTNVIATGQYQGIYLAGAYFHRGKAKQINGDTDAAISDYNHTIALAPTAATAYSNRGTAKQR